MAIGRSVAWVGAGATKTTCWEEPCSRCGRRSGWMAGSWNDKLTPAGHYYIRCLACGAEHLVKK